MTDIVVTWLQGFSVDCLRWQEGWAVFPQGERLLSQSTDILGNVKRRKRLSFLIRRNCLQPQPGDMEAFARWAEDTAPILGENQTVRLEDARLESKSKEDMHRHKAMLIFEFTERFSRGEAD